ASLVLWFQFNEDKKERIGIEYYLQAKGGQPAKKDEEVSWNEASTRHQDCKREFESAMEQWSSKAAPGSWVDVTTVRFNGKKRNWMGAGVEAPDGPQLRHATPQDALAFLKDNSAAMWRFPRVGPGEAATIEEAAPQVRKPALALRAPLDCVALAACGDDGTALQRVLRTAMEGIAAKRN